MAKTIKTAARSVNEEVPLTGPVIPPGGMVVGKIEVAQDASPARAAGQPAHTVAVTPKVGTVLPGDFVRLKIDSKAEIYRPFLIVAVDSSRKVSGHVFFSPFDGTLEGPLTKLRVRLSSAGLVQYITDVPEGPGLWEWSLR